MLINLNHHGYRLYSFPAPMKNNRCILLATTVRVIGIVIGCFHENPLYIHHCTMLKKTHLFLVLEMSASRDPLRPTQPVSGDCPWYWNRGRTWRPRTDGGDLRWGNVTISFHNSKNNGTYTHMRTHAHMYIVLYTYMYHTLYIYIYVCVCVIVCNYVYCFVI